MGNIYAEDLTARCPGLVFNIQFDFLEPTCRNFFFHVFDEEKYLRQTPLTTKTLKKTVPWEVLGKSSHLWSVVQTEIDETTQAMGYRESMRRA